MGEVVFPFGRKNVLKELEGLKLVDITVDEDEPGEPRTLTMLFDNGKELTAWVNQEGDMIVESD